MILTISDKLQIIRDHQKQYPVKTTSIAKALGLTIFHATWAESEMSGISGMIKRDKQAGSSGYAIYVNKDHHSNRRRFTIAHEIAHYVLHQDKIGDGIVDDGLYRSGLTNKIEIEANNLAADILMPWHLIKEAMKGNNANIASLAKLFSVSNSSMSIRLGFPYES